MHRKTSHHGAWTASLIAIALCCICGRVGAAGLTFVVDDATFSERIIGPFGDEITGSDLGIAETVSDSGSKTIDPVTFSWDAQVSADAKGPQATAALDISSAITDPGGLGADATVVSLISYSLVVYNKTGTPAPASVPLQFKGFYALSSTFSGPVRYATAGVVLSAFRADSGVGSVVFNDMLSTVNPGPPVSGAFSGVFPVLVGNAANDSVAIDVNLSASVRGWVEALKYSDSEVFEGDAKLFSYIDPEIFIDPTWDQADDFGLAFSANIQPFAAPIPLPAAWILMSLGMAGLSLRWRR